MARNRSPTLVHQLNVRRFRKSPDRQHKRTKRIPCGQNQGSEDYGYGEELAALVNT